MIHLKNLLSKTLFLTSIIGLTFPIIIGSIIAGPTEEEKEIWSMGYLYGFQSAICKLREEGFISEYHSNIAAERSFSVYSKKLGYMTSREFDDQLESLQNSA
tara:strand:+ start:774 stop:1079 length:306 start_codon:yes stop_codon:yes gene_type:complete